MNVVTDQGDVKILACGEQIMEQLLTYFFEEDSEVGDFTDPESGRWMNIKRTGKGKGDRQTKYIVRPGASSDSLDQWDEVKEMLHDLDKAAGELKSVEAVKALLEGDDEAASDDDSEEATDEDVEAEADEDVEAEADEEEETPKAKVKGKVTKPACFGDADEHDPEDDTCQECAFFEPCKLEPDVAEKYVQIRKAAKRAKLGK